MLVANEQMPSKKLHKIYISLLSLLFHSLIFFKILILLNELISFITKDRATQFLQLNGNLKYVCLSAK